MLFDETFLTFRDRCAPICSFLPKKNLLLKIRSKQNHAHKKWKNICQNQAKLQEFKKWLLKKLQQIQKALLIKHFSSLPTIFKNVQSCKQFSRTYNLLNDINGKSKGEVESIYRCLQNNLSSGDELISNNIVKASMHATLIVITVFVNRLLNGGLFPDSLKTVKIITLFKDGSKLDENIYRQFLIIWRIFEKVL